MAPNSDEPWNASSQPTRTDLVAWAAFAAAGLASALIARFAHVSLLWIEEAYGLAAAREILNGKQLYSQIWFDKPPAYAWYYLLSGGLDGWPLRILNCLLIAAIAAVTFGMGRRLWGVREGLAAAGLITIALTFWIPSAVMAAAPDMLMIMPHLAAVWLAIERKPFLAGLASGFAVLANAKGAAVLLAAALWAWPGIGWLVAGFLLVQGTSLALLPVHEYVDQVWLWGIRYSRSTFIDQPVYEGVARTLAWAGFHATPVIGAGVYLVRSRDWRFALWIVIALAAVAGGLRFFPRYYFHVLPVVVVAGARGLMLLTPRWRAAVLALLLIPIVRFGPRYVLLMTSGGDTWSDTAMMSDSRRAAAILARESKPRDTLLVWGYRPDIFIFSKLNAGSPFLDSQPLTGVLADRHLISGDVLYPELAARNRALLAGYRPTFIVDGLGPVNPTLAIDRYPDLANWLAGYQMIGRTGMSRVYRLQSGPGGRSLPEER